MTATPPSGTGSSLEQERDASDWAVQYAEQEDLPGDPPPDDGRVRVQLLTDPWSVWCWGFEPVARALRLRYPSIEFGYLLGGMFERLPDPEAQGFSLDRFFTTVQRTTGVPIRWEGLERDRPDSTYPACVHVHAVHLLDPSVSEGYLRALREAAYLDGRNISDPSVAADVAGQIGIEADSFEEAMASGEPEREFQHRLALLERHDLHAYPTLLFTVGDQRAQVQGFQTLASVLSVAETLSGRLHPSVPAPELEDVLDEGQRVATREVAEVLDISVEQASERLAEAAEQDVVERERYRTGDVWRLTGTTDPG